MICLQGWAVFCLAATPLPENVLFEQSSAAVVKVLTDTGSGSGFLINDQGHFVTNHHVVEGGRNFAVQRGLRSAPADLIWQSADLDLAVIRIAGNLSGLRPLPLALSAPLPLQDVVSIGYPGAADTILTSNEATPSFTEGAVGRVVDGSWNNVQLRIIQHNADINPGSSGGPLLDRCGRAVGVNTAGPAARITMDTLLGGPLESPNGVFFASFIGELAEALRQESIPFNSTGDPCSASASPPAEPANSDSPVEEATEQAQAEQIPQQPAVSGSGAATPEELQAGAEAEQISPQQAAQIGNELNQSRNWLIILAVMLGVIAALIAAALISFGSLRQSLVQVGLGATQWARPTGRGERRRESVGAGTANEVTIRIGRGKDMDLRLRSAKVSRLHAKLTVLRNAADGRLDYRLRDCRSSNGSRVFRNGGWRDIVNEAVLAGEPLRLGDQETTASELYADWLRTNPGNAGAAKSALGRGGKASPTSKDELPSGRVKRDYRTGDVIRD